MADRWYYAHEGSRTGPYSSGQFRALAIAGDILVTDTVWLNDSEQGVVASRVRNLFRPTPTPAAPVAEAACPQPAPAETLREQPLHAPVASAAAVAEALAEQPVTRPTPAYQDHLAPRKLRAIALSGAMIVGQDGKIVRYRKKCSTCGHEDSSWATQPITVGVMKARFFCPKCRKNREVQIRGQQG